MATDVGFVVGWVMWGDCWVLVDVGVVETLVGLMIWRVLNLGELEQGDEKNSNPEARSKGFLS